MDNLLDLFNKLPKLNSIYGFTAGYEIVFSESDNKHFYECLFRYRGQWVKANITRDEVASFQSENLTESTLNALTERFPTDVRIEQLELPTSVKALSSQLSEQVNSSYNCDWVDIQIDDSLVGYFNLSLNTLMILSESDLFRHSGHTIQVDSGGYRAKGIDEVYSFNLISPSIYGVLPTAAAKDCADRVAQKIRLFESMSHRRIIPVESIANQDSYFESYDDGFYRIVKNGEVITLVNNLNELGSIVPDSQGFKVILETFNSLEKPAFVSSFADALDRLWLKRSIALGAVHA
ncbi:hypothetical protein A1QO_00720 [Vibrio genomosp. F10 str. ZF-129]|uniref:Uncharacterized protein n=1 Tax=Vibrio genomosp. F10 str. ZF-129 TaxID=1187848 RepID=A0A1E5BHB2_9VIBR|nr:hypothetical protein [Vibrio genomosp. F10]OEE35315.1 hypothetical protein A1QO_00720 [Vibrio genomosp. F10 str. ZF-129]